MPILGVIASGVSGNLWPSSSYESIQTGIGTGSSGTITFSSIPSTYKHLQIRCTARSSSVQSTEYILIRLNNDTTANYTYHGTEGSGTAASAFGSTGETAGFGTEVTGAGATSNIMGTAIIDILDYASSTKNKTIRHFGGDDKNGTGLMGIRTNLWLSTSAINRIDIISYRAANWTTTSSFALYGIKG
jgi:hypothetical protein